MPWQRPACNHRFALLQLHAAGAGNDTHRIPGILHHRDRPPHRYQGDTEYTYYDSFKTKVVADIHASHLAHSDKVFDIKVEEHDE